MTVRVRGIYATALTALLEDVVQASPPIRERFEEEFPVDPAGAVVGTTGDRQGVGVHGTDEAVEGVVSRLREVGRDTFAWEAALARGGAYAGEVVETLDGGALVACHGDGTQGFLPYSKTARHVDTGDRLRVQVTEPRAPWRDGRPVLDTTVRVHGALASLVRGGATTTDAPELADILPTEPPDGWFALDDHRRGMTTTMAGHHRIKAGRGSASEAVDFVEAVCDDPGEGEFPFGAVTRQFGPQEGDSVSIGHGKPDGRCFDLGPGEVTACSADGEVTVRRKLTPGGTYDAIGGEIQPGDVAVTKFREGRWWYPTVYRGENGETRGTYVNVCTPVEVFPQGARYVDLHVDVVKYPDGTVERVDEDELAAAREAGNVSAELAEKARAVACAVENAF